MTLDNLFGQYGFERIYSEEILEDTGQESTIAVLYRKIRRIAEIKKNVVSRAHIENFIKEYSEVDKQLEDTLRRIVKTGSEVVLYGIGARLLQLLKAHSVFEHINVVGCIDGKKAARENESAFVLKVMLFMTYQNWNLTIVLRC